MSYYTDEQGCRKSWFKDAFLLLWSASGMSPQALCVWEAKDRVALYLSVDLSSEELVAKCAIRKWGLAGGGSLGM